MLMSKSRLEKFLYALYSLDSSDLPTPLSRIEELYNCWVTGEEAPTFKPLSRVEKYLMAILGVYDVNELPNPISRVEVLLYKLAIGDDNLDDFKSFLSEHEELLAEIIRNGGAGGNINIEYVLYTLSTEFNTLYNTAEKPVKSAILKGNTMNNLLCDYSISESTVKMNHKNIVGKVLIKNMCKGEQCFFKRLETTTGVYKGATLITSNNFIYEVPDGQHIAIIYDDESVITASELLENAMIIKYQEGMENWDIPYFEGMKSVQMPVLTTIGKNLFDGYLEKGIIDGNTGLPSRNESFVRSVNFIKVQSNKTYTISEKDDSTDFRIYEFDGNFNYIGQLSKKTFTTSSNTSYIKFRTYPKNSGDDVSSLDFKFMLETGNTITPYEPYKSNILTVNEEIELRGIGEVKDELDLMTGGVTRRITEVVFDGSENWSITYHNVTNRKRYSLNGVTFPFTNYREISDSFATGKSFWNLDETGMYIGTNGKLLIAFQTTDNRYNYTIDEFKKYLSENPVKLQYIIEEFLESTSLTTKDQDGNDTELSTFNDITHVTLSSEGLIPEAELEVATKNEEDLGDSIVYTAHTLSEEFNTLYNTAEKPVKSAILKGQTLVNLFNINDVKYYNNDKDHYIENDYIVLPVVNKMYNHIKIPKEKCSMFKPSTKYTLWVHMLENHTEDNGDGTTQQNGSFWLQSYDYSESIVKSSNNGFYGCKFENNETGIKSCVFETHDLETMATKTQGINFDLPCYYAKTGGIQKLAIVILEGEYSIDELPFNATFEGMQSVKMPVLTTTGKNLFDGELKAVNLSDAGVEQNSKQLATTTNFIKVSPKMTFSSHDLIGEDVVVVNRFNEYDENKNFIRRKVVSHTNPYTYTPTDENVKYVTVTFRTPALKDISLDEFKEVRIQIEHGSVATSYEPYQSNILTVNDPIELGGIGVLQDELKLLTGELIQRTEEIKIKGNENWVLTETTEKGCIFRSEGINILKSVTTNIMNDKYPYYSTASKYDGGYGVLSATTTGKIRIITPLNTTLEEFKTKLASDQPTFRFELAEPTIKTVDLSIVDQDGNDTKLSTFNDITHVTLSSEGLIPEAELEVAEKVPEVAASMLTISREQEVINATTNEQSENVDSTMIATTEIYEELL